MTTPNDWNVSDREKTMESPTLEQCRAMGRTHRAYKWAKSPWGCWNAEQLAAYNAGFSEAESVREYYEEVDRWPDK